MNTTTLPLGFMVLCSDLKPKSLALSISYLRLYSDAEIVAILPPTKDADLMQEFSALCPTFRSRDSSLPSMFNKGFKATKSKWLMILRSGDKLKTNFHQRFSWLMSDDKDMYCPICFQNCNIADSSISGWVVSRSAFTAVGNMNDLDSDELSRLVWMMQADEAGYRIKGVAGLYTGSVKVAVNATIISDKQPTRRKDSRPRRGVPRGRRSSFKTKT